MKTLILGLSLSCLTIGSNIYAQEGSGKTKVYYEVISNSTKSTDYTIGVYPGSYSYVSSDDGGYSTMNLRIINNSTYAMNWGQHNKIFVLLKTGELFCNYLTKAQDGVNACSYTINSKETHEQTMCFDRQFEVSNIDKVWVFDSDHDSILSLVFDEL